MNRLEQHKFPPARFGLNDCSFTQKNCQLVSHSHPICGNKPVTQVAHDSFPNDSPM